MKIFRFNTWIGKTCTRALYYKQFFFLNFFYEIWGHLFTTINQKWLSLNNLQVSANAIHDKGVSLENCWGFLDGTVSPLRRPRENQRIMYNGH